jgi:hypothetical protein
LSWVKKGATTNEERIVVEFKLQRKLKEERVGA